MVSVRTETFWKRLQQLEKEVAYREMQKRNWCSYTELNCLMNSSQLIAIASSVTLVCCICLMAYVVCFLIMFGSTFVLQAITLCGIWFVRTWQIVNLNLNETNVMPRGDIPPNSLIGARSCVFNDEHMMPACSLFDDYEDQDYITAEIQNNENEYAVEDANNSDISWQWWLNSTMTWLAEYSNSKNLTSQVTKFDDTESILNDTKYSFNSTRNEIMRNMKDFMQYWRKVLRSILNRLITRWTGLNNLHHRIFSQSINSIDFLVPSRRFDR